MDKNVIKKDKNLSIKKMQKFTEKLKSFLSIKIENVAQELEIFPLKRKSIVTITHCVHFVYLCK